MAEQSLPRTLGFYTPWFIGQYVEQAMFDQCLRALVLLSLFDGLMHRSSHFGCEA